MSILRRIWISAALAIAALAVTSSAAMAAANFHGQSFSINNSGQLVCFGDVSGLGNVSTTEGTCSATSSATYQCINNGGKNPAAGNKTTVTGTTSAGGTFDVRNGRTRATILLNPTGEGAFSCPGGQTMFLTAVTYSNITMEIGGATADGGTISRNDLMVRQ